MHVCTNEPAVIIQKKNPRKGINDEALEKAEERFKSERIYKEVGISDTIRDDTCLEVKGTEDEYDSEPDLSSGKTNKGSIHTETFDPIEVINEVNTRISTSLISLEGNDARMVDNNIKSINNDIHCSRLSFKKSNEDTIVSPSESNTYDAGKAAVIDKVEDIVPGIDSAFAFEVFSEEDTLGRWLYTAGDTSLMQKSNNLSDTKRSLISDGTGEKDELESIKIATEDDIKKVRLEVKKNTFVSVNGVEIEENTNINSDIRNLLNHLVSKEKVTNTNSYKGKTKGIIKTTCKTMLKVVNCEESNICILL